MMSVAPNSPSARIQASVRAEGDKVRLPDGDYTIEFSRGPESVPRKRSVHVDASTRELAFQVERWIDPAQYGWYSVSRASPARSCKISNAVDAP